MIDKLKALWGGKAFNFLGILVALAGAVIVDWKFPATGHVAIYLPLLLAGLTELGAFFGPVDLTKVFNARVRSVLLLGANALTLYLTSDPRGSAWRYAPAGLALIMSLERALGIGAAAKLALLAVLMAIPGASGCAHVDAVVKDVDSCVKADAPGDEQDIMRASAQYIATVIMCGAPTGFTTLPACAVQALGGVEAALGHDGLAFEQCVVTTIESDPNATAELKARAKAAHALVNAKLAARNGR